MIFETSYVVFNMLKDFFACYMGSKTMLLVLDPNVPPQMFEFTADRCGLRPDKLDSLPFLTRAWGKLLRAFSIVTWKFMRNESPESLAS